MKINAVIINGRHGGQVLSIEYSPRIKLPITNEEQISIGEDYDKSVRIGDKVEYKECFRGIGKRWVLYSTNGEDEDINYILGYFKQTYPIKLF